MRKTSRTIVASTVAELRGRAQPMLAGKSVSEWYSDREAVVAYCKETDRFYVWDASSAAADDGLDTIAAAGGLAVGRWRAEGAGLRVTAYDTEAEITAIPVAALQDGASVWHTGQKAYWTLDTTSVPVSTHEIIASSDAGRRWVRETTLHKVWLNAWFTIGVHIDGTLGDDEGGDGEAMAPLKTWAEARRRLGVGPGGVVQIPTTGAGVLVATFAAGSYDEVLDLRGISGAIDVVGAESTVTSGTLNAIVALNRATGQHQQVGTAAFDFTPHKRRWLVLTSGASAGARALVESIPSANHAQVATFATLDLSAFGNSPAPVTPAGNETFDVRIPATFFRDFAFEMGSANAGSSASTGLGSIYRIRSVALIGPGGAHSTNYSVRGRGYFVWCDFSQLSDGSANSTLVVLVNGFTTSAIFQQCAVRRTSSSGYSTTRFQACLIATAAGSSVVTGSSCRITADTDTLFSDATIAPNDWCDLAVGDVGFANVAAAKHALDLSAVGFAGARVRLTGTVGLYGAAAGAGAIGVKTGAFVHVQGAGLTPTLTTAGANIAFGSANKTWAQVPFYDIAVGAPALGENFACWK